MNKYTNIPNGLMCVGCIHALRNCSHLKFDEMRVIKVYKDGFREVKCSEYLKNDKSSEKLH